ncbi:MAG: polysaccharide deacetylase family protein [Hyphomicrobiaceae bacterium]
MRNTTRFILFVAIACFGTTAPAWAKKKCEGNDNALGVSRVVQIDTTGGPGFGFQHYKAYDFLRDGEVVITFDDGPLPGPTGDILKALAKHCAKATFFPVGKLAVGYPQVLKRVYDEGHTVGSHTWSHADIGKKDTAGLREEIEKGVSAARLAIGKPVAPFFRHPYLKDSEKTIAYLAERNVAVFSTDLDSFDFKRGSAKRLIARVMGNLKKKRKGIILFHDINKTTAKAMPQFLNALKAGGYKIVHLKAKTGMETIAKFDEEVGKSFKGRISTGKRPINSVVSTIEEDGQVTAKQAPAATSAEVE